ncbi:phosphopantetheine-binding protein [Streptomyces sp. NPDC026589]|uniref:acyl carrier protein n=1 Tax=Streptomyces sp. NPDC026589 TaxID=3155609 RepID=UPI0033E15D88
MAMHRDAVVDEISERVKAIIPAAAAAGLAPDNDLLERGMDSLAVLELLVWIEGRFSFSIPDEELIMDNFSSIDKMVEYVMANRS